jgi:hypothetical protein
MFFLVFLVMFNVKKGSNVVYAFNFYFYLNNSLLVPLFKNLFIGFEKNWLRFISHKYQYTALTSRLTSYVLLSFWIFFFFYGETLLLVLFNYSTPLDTIVSSNFLVIKQHVVFFISSTSTKLITYINFYIFFFTLSAFFYMINLSFTHTYNYFFYSTLNSVLIIVFVFLYILFII